MLHAGEVGGSILLSSSVFAFRRRFKRFRRIFFQLHAVESNRLATSLLVAGFQPKGKGNLFNILYSLFERAVTQVPYRCTLTLDSWAGFSSHVVIQATIPRKRSTCLFALYLRCHQQDPSSRRGLRQLQLQVANEASSFPRHCARTSFLSAKKEQHPEGKCRRCW